MDVEPVKLTRVSYGILLFRINKISRRPEVLLIHRRYSYAFIDFLLGKYTTSIIPCQKYKFKLMNIKMLLQKMTIDELLMIRSLNFGIMWEHVWLGKSIQKTESYKKRESKFNYLFISADEGSGLIKMLDSIKTEQPTLWDFSKGTKFNPKESGIACAIRELYEETGIDKENYRILPDAETKLDFIDVNVNYKYNLFVGLCVNDVDIKHKLKVSSVYKCGELNDMDWFDIEDLRRLKAEKILTAVEPMAKVIKKFCKDNMM